MKKWQSNFTHLKTHSKICFVREKPTECTSNTISKIAMISVKQKSK